MVPRGVGSGGKLIIHQTRGAVARNGSMMVPRRGTSGGMHSTLWGVSSECHRVSMFTTEGTEEDEGTVKREERDWTQEHFDSKLLFFSVFLSSSQAGGAVGGSWPAMGAPHSGHFSALARTS